MLCKALAHATPGFGALFDKIEDTLATFLKTHTCQGDRNVEMLARLTGLDAPEAAFLQLAAAFCYSPFERQLFNFIDSPTGIHRAIETICDVRGGASARLIRHDGGLARLDVLTALKGRRSSRLDFADLLQLTPTGEALLGTLHADELSMARVILKPFERAQAATALDWPHLRAQQSLLRSALSAALDQKTPGVNFLIYGGPGTGKTEFVRQLVADVGAVAFAVTETDDIGEEATRGERLANLRLSQAFLGQSQRVVLVLDEAEDIFRGDYHQFFSRSNESKAWMNALLEKNPHPVIWIGNRISQLDPAYLRRFSYCLEFPATPVVVRNRIARDKLGAVGCSDAIIDTVAALPAVTPAHLDAAARFARLCQTTHTAADAAVESLIRSHLKAGGQSDLPLRPQRVTRFDMRYLNIAGNMTPERVLQSLERATPAGESAESAETVAATLLFSGPPGTGKTQLAAEIATRLGRRLVVRTASDINSMWYGESEANVARMFRDCDPRDELLFLDEAEVLLGARESTNHRADRAVTAEFLRWLEVFQGVFICATNHAASFDAALMRRFTFRLEFRPLTFAQRSELYAELALERMPSEAVADRPEPEARDAARLARLDLLTPGDFANVARRVKALGLPAAAWLDELEAEQRAKNSLGGLARPMGFV
jgi:SpoVK/Ycf46/Vps4 family AAA+-type ATPase